MAVMTEGLHDAEGIVSEGAHSYSREKVTVTVVDGLDYPPMMPVAKITATGKYVPWDIDAAAPSDGTETIVGVLIYGLEGHADGSTDVDRTGVILARHAQVNESEMSWFKYDASDANGLEAYSAGNITTAKAHLQAVGIIVRPVA
jgi:hypothetical protein